jgi:putative membrane protein
MMSALPYCGLAATPEALWTRFNLDPVLLVALVLVTAAHLRHAPPRRSAYALSGWAVATAAFMSPLCALSVSLFSARIAQHMILLLIAAPLIGLALPPGSPGRARWRLWSGTGAFLIALWFWHMPAPYDATFASTPCYWLMHVTLLGSAIFLWRELLQHADVRVLDVLGAGLVTSVQMGLLGAVLTMAARPLFYWHLSTTQAWGLTPLQDQQLGGVLMWVPGIALFLWAALRALGRLRLTLEPGHGR